MKLMEILDEAKLTKISELKNLLNQVPEKEIRDEIKKFHDKLMDRFPQEKKYIDGYCFDEIAGTFRHDYRELEDKKDDLSFFFSVPKYERWRNSRINQEKLFSWVDDKADLKESLNEEVIKLDRPEPNSKGELCSYAIKSHSSDKILSKHKSRKEAEKRLKQIQMFKHMKG